MVNAEASPMSSLILQLLSPPHIPLRGAKPGSGEKVVKVKGNLSSTKALQEKPLCVYPYTTSCTLGNYVRVLYQM